MVAAALSRLSREESVNGRLSSSQPVPSNCRKSGICCRISAEIPVRCTSASHDGCLRQGGCNFYARRPQQSFKELADVRARYWFEACAHPCNPFIQQLAKMSCSQRNCQKTPPFAQYPKECETTLSWGQFNLPLRRGDTVRGIHSKEVDHQTGAESDDAPSTRTPMLTGPTAHGGADTNRTYFSPLNCGASSSED